MQFFQVAVLFTLIWSMAGQSADKQPGASSSGTPVARPEMIPEAPDFELKSLDGKLVRLSSLRGKAVVLNFWASWCVPCRKETPWLVQYQKKFGPKGLVILGISMDESENAARQFVKEKGISYPVLFGTQAVADRYFVKGLPVSIFIDREGRITDQVPGMPNESFLQNEIELALAN